MLMKLLKNRALMFTGATALLLILMGGVPLLTQTTFDPATELPADCVNGKMQCGLEVESKRQVDAVPEDRANFVAHRGLPRRVDLSANFPPVGSQGRQGSCVAWTTGYNIKSYQERVERRWSFDADPGVYKRCSSSATKVFSPAYIYNQINHGRDRGSSIYNALNLMVRGGAAPCNYMAYDARDYLTQPSSAAKRAAAKYKGKSVKRVDCHNDRALKAVLASKNPLAAGFKVTKDLYSVGRGVWDTFTPPVRGGHAMVIMGYDDSKRSAKGHVGAYKILNSWGTRFGDSGYTWISYRNMKTVCKYSYVMYDQVDSKKKDEPDPGENTDKKKVTAPGRVTATQGSYSSKVVVSWEKVQNAYAYGVYRAEPGSSSFRRIAYAGSDDTSHNDSSVQKATAYRYRVQAIGQNNRSNINDSPTAEGYSKKATNNTTSKPGRVLGVAGRTTGGGGVELRWNSVSGATSYRVVRYDPNRRSWNTLTSSVRATGYNDRKPFRGKKNFYAVRAQNSAGKGAWSSTTRVFVGGGGGDVVSKPSKPGSGSATLGTHRSKIVFSWERAAGATSYVVVRYNRSGRRWEILDTVSGTSYEDTSRAIKNGRKHYYSVAAKNAQGTSTYLSPVGGKTTPNLNRAGSKLSPPANVHSSTSSAGKITIRWDKVKGASEYYVFRKKEKGRKFKFVKALGKGSLTFSEKLPSKGAIYLYTIKSKTALGGESEESRMVSGVWNKDVVSPRHRFLAGEGLDRFKGTWTAYHLKQKKAYKLTMTVTGQGSKFNVVMKSKRFWRDKKLKGRYANKSSSLSGDRFHMRLLDKYSAAVKLGKGKLYSEELDIVFTKQ